MKKFFIAALLVTAFTSAKTYAQQQEPQKPKHDHEGIFKKLDTDNDGKISKTEAEKQEQGRFKLIDKFTEIDTNKDSFIDKEELKAFRKTMKEKRQSGGGTSK
jgi:Ca2+-binding EF-hand superfamily protein